MWFLLSNRRRRGRRGWKPIRSGELGRVDGQLSGPGTADSTVRYHPLVGHQLEHHARMVAAKDNVGVSEYGIYRGGSRVSSVTSPSGTVSGLTCGTSYAVGVDAADATGNRSSLTMVTAATSACSSSTPPSPGGTPDTQPPAGPVLSLGPATQTSLVLNWQAGSDNVGIDHYNVYRGTSDELSGQVKIAETKQLSYTYTGLTCGTDYSLALVAEDAAGNKSILAEAIWYPVRTLACSATTPPPPPPSGGTPDTQPPTSPTNPVVTATTSSSVTVNWTASTDNVGVPSYGVYRGTSLLSTTTRRQRGIRGLPVERPTRLASTPSTQQATAPLAQM